MNLISVMTGRMQLANEGMLLPVLGCAIALFGAFLLARHFFALFGPAADPAAGFGRAPGAEAAVAASLESLESRLRAAGVAESHIPARLQDAAGVLVGLRGRLADDQPEALALLDCGDFGAASAVLKAACDARLAAGEGDSDPEAAQGAAEICAAAAALDRLNLDYRAAADKYAAAADLVAAAPERDAPRAAEWRYRLAQARALADDGAENGASESLIAAIETYDKAFEAVSRREAPLDWAATHFYRGEALLASGAAADSKNRIEDAVDSYKLALEEWTQAAAPFEWARTQHNLGDALQRLAEMDDGIERLRPAADAYRAALREWTQAAAPSLWAMAQGKLGDALSVIGARTGDEAALREAIGAYRAALSELRRELAPQEWARLQNNLGAALAALSEQEFCERIYERDQLRCAVEAFESALDGQTAEDSPAEFAATSLHLADSLLALGEAEAAENPAYGADLLGRAAAAYRAALAAPCDRAPGEAAKIRINLAYALGLLWSGARNRHMLHEALAMIEDAISMLEGTPDRERIADAERARETIRATLAQAA